MNFLAGIMILMSRQFTIGDFIKVNGTLGKIIEIKARNTVLQAIDGTRVIVPNADLFNNQVTSMTSNPFRRIEVETAIDYRINMENAIKVCMQAVKKTEGVLLEPKPAVIYTGFGDSNIDMKVRCWVQSRSPWLKIKSNLIKNLMEEYNKYGITMAYNTVNLLNDKENPIDEKIIEKKKALKVVGAKLVATPAGNGAGNANAVPVVTGQTLVTPATQVAEAVPVKADDDDDKPLKPLAETKNL
jgi:small-conductance mechanosensitive channel